MSETWEPLEEFDRALEWTRRLWIRADDRRRFIAETGELVERATLRVLSAISQAEQPSIGEVGFAMMVDASTASRMVEQAVARGFVARSPGEGDRRKSQLALTESGEAMLQKFVAARRKFLRQATDSWTLEEIQECTALLERLRTYFTAGPDS